MAILYQCHNGSVDRAMDCRTDIPGSIPPKSQKFFNLFKWGIEPKGEQQQEEQEQQLK